MTRKFERVEMKEDGCGLSELCPRCGNGYTVTCVSIAGQHMDVCDLCANEIIDAINEPPKRDRKMKEYEVIELKPCPFCGTYAKLHSEPTIYGPDKPGWYVQCGSSLCWAQTRSYGVKEQAIRTWNKRVNE